MTTQYDEFDTDEATIQLEAVFDFTVRYMREAGKVRTTSFATLSGLATGIIHIAAQGLSAKYEEATAKFLTDMKNDDFTNITDISIKLADYSYKLARHHHKIKE